MYKNLFPIFKNNNMVFLDTASSAQKPQVVLDVMVDFYQNSYANVHRGSYELSSIATTMYEEARQKVAAFINASSKKEVVFTKGTTESINLVASGFEKLLSCDDEILVSVAEHHANFVPWQQLAKKTGAKFVVFDILDNGELDLDDFSQKLSSKTKIVAVSQLSNVLGIENQLDKLIQKSHQVGAKVLVDGAQGVAHLKTDVQLMDCDFYVFSGHKLYAPTGIGVLYGKKDCLELLSPYQYGGDMVKTVSIAETSFKGIPTKFEAGTPPFVEAISLVRAIDFISDISIQKIAEHEKNLTDYLMKKLHEINGIDILAMNDKKQGIVAFTVQGIHPTDIAYVLAEQGICVRVGHHCAMPLHARLNKDVSLRASFGIYNNETDVDLFVNALKKSISLFKKEN